MVNINYSITIYHPFPPRAKVGPQRPSAATLPAGPATTTGAVGGPLTTAPCPLTPIVPPPLVIRPPPRPTTAP